MERPSPETLVRSALASRDPTIITKLFDPPPTYDKMLRLRDQIKGVIIEPRDYHLMFDWLWHEDNKVASAIRMVVLWIGDMKFTIEIFSRLVQVEVQEVPFTISYNSSEGEFGVGLPGVPGWGVSHYGESHDIDLLLQALEKVYATAHPAWVPPWFRTT